jgi:amidohydrolase
LVKLTGTARSFTEEAGRALPEKIARVVRGTAEASGVQARLDYRRVNRATVNDREMAELFIETAREIFGEENVETETRTLGGEDMSVFLSRVPGCFFFVGSAPAGGHRPHHSPDFDIDERSLALATVLFEAVALKSGPLTLAGLPSSQSADPHPCLSPSLPCHSSVGFLARRAGREASTG